MRELSSHSPASAALDQGDTFHDYTIVTLRARDALLDVCCVPGAPFELKPELIEWWRGLSPAAREDVLFRADPSLRIGSKLTTPRDVDALNPETTFASLMHSPDAFVFELTERLDPRNFDRMDADPFIVLRSLLDAGAAVDTVAGGAGQISGLLEGRTSIVITYNDRDFDYVRRVWGGAEDDLDIAAAGQLDDSSASSRVATPVAQGEGTAPSRLSPLEITGVGFGRRDMHEDEPIEPIMLTATNGTMQEFKWKKSRHELRAFVLGEKLALLPIELHYYCVLRALRSVTTLFNIVSVWRLESGVGIGEFVGQDAAQAVRAAKQADEAGLSVGAATAVTSGFCDWDDMSNEYGALKEAKELFREGCLKVKRWMADHNLVEDLADGITDITNVFGTDEKALYLRQPGVPVPQDLAAYAITGEELREAAAAFVDLPEPLAVRLVKEQLALLLLLMTGQHAAVTEHAERIIKMFPNHARRRPDVRTTIARLFYLRSSSFAKMRQLPQSLVAADKSLEFETTAVVHTAKANLLLQMEKPLSQVLGELVTAVQLTHPDSRARFETLLHLSDYASRAGDDDLGQWALLCALFARRRQVFLHGPDVLFDKVFFESVLAKSGDGVSQMAHISRLTLPNGLKVRTLLWNSRMTESYFENGVHGRLIQFRVGDVMTPVRAQGAAQGEICEKPKKKRNRRKTRKRR
jgi:hypothetical protein